MLKIKRKPKTCPACGYPLVKEIRWTRLGNHYVLACCNSNCRYETAYYNSLRK